MQPPSTFFSKSPETLQHELRGFPAWGVDAAIKFQQTRAVDEFNHAVLGVMEFYLPKALEGSGDLRDYPAETKLREDLDVDSLSITEAAFKLEEVFDITIDTRELIGITTLGGLKQHFANKLQAGQ